MFKVSLSIPEAYNTAMLKSSSSSAKITTELGVKLQTLQHRYEMTIQGSFLMAADWGSTNCDAVDLLDEGQRLPSLLQKPEWPASPHLAPVICLMRSLAVVVPKLDEEQVCVGTAKRTVWRGHHQSSRRDDMQTGRSQFKVVHESWR